MIKFCYVNNHTKKKTNKVRIALDWYHDGDFVSIYAPEKVRQKDGQIKTAYKLVSQWSDGRECAL